MDPELENVVSRFKPENVAHPKEILVNHNFTNPQVTIPVDADAWSYGNVKDAWNYKNVNDAWSYKNFKDGWNYKNVKYACINKYIYSCLRDACVNDNDSIILYNGPKGSKIDPMETKSHIEIPRNAIVPKGNYSALKDPKSNVIPTNLGMC